MIVVEQSEVRKSQLDHDPDAPAATSSTPLIQSESPPAYTPRENRGPCSSSAPYHNTPSSPATQKRRPKSVAKRFVKALLLAFGSYVAIVFVIRFLLFVMDPSLHDFRRGVGHPGPEDGRVIRCIRGGDHAWPPTSHVSFDIPLDSSAIYLLARGLQANGRITVVPHQTATSDVITVDIAAEYRDWDLFRSTAVCLLERRRGEQVVGVFTPKHLVWTNRRTDVEITVKIPHQPAGPVLELPVFEIVAPEFQVTLPDTEKFVNFHDLTIHTSGVPVTVESVRAANIDILTSNFGIHGTFITNSSLTLTTSNAPITANILLGNDWASVKGSSVHTTTASGSLTGAIPLLSNMRVPRYTIRAATTNAGLNLSFPQHPDSPHSSSAPILDVYGNASNGSAKLLLPSSFEGIFDVSTSPNYQADFSSASSSGNDPLGLGRERHIDLTTTTQSWKEGRVYWGDLDDGRELGRVELSTSNAPVSLHIQ